METLISLAVQVGGKAILSLVLLMTCGRDEISGQRASLQDLSWRLRLDCTKSKGPFAEMRLDFLHVRATSSCETSLSWKQGLAICRSLVLGVYLNKRVYNL